MSFLGVFASLKRLVNATSVTIDNSVSCLHYKVTMTILMVFSVVVTSKQFVGDPIHCTMADNKVIPLELVESYCWIHGTHTISRYFEERKEADFKPVHPGVGPVGPVGPLSEHEDENTLIHHKYYQWVCFVLVLQAALFYVPHLLWKSCEGGHIKLLVDKLRSQSDFDKTEEEKLFCRKIVVDHFYKTLNMHNFYAYKFFFCEILNFINVIAQIYLMDSFLGGQFSSLGLYFLAMNNSTPDDPRVEPMSYVFPKVAKCEFEIYGPTGGSQLFDALCVLPVNVINEKIYVFLWFWFMFVSVVTGMVILVELAVILMPRWRTKMLQAQSCDMNVAAAKKCQIGDWFVLYQISQNVDSFTYQEFISDLAKKLNCKIAAHLEFA